MTLLSDMAMTATVLFSLGMIAALGAVPALMRHHVMAKKQSDEVPLLDYDDGPPRQRHSETSSAAADNIKSKAGTFRERVRECLELHGPQTDEEMQDRLKMNPSTQRPRRIELWQAGEVKEAGFTRPTRSGRNAAVWKLVGEPAE